MAEVTTAVGHRWFCDACPLKFDTPYGARAHVAEVAASYAEGRAPYQHFAIEAEELADGSHGKAARWIYVDTGGTIRLGEQAPGRTNWGKGRSRRGTTRT